VEEAKSDDAGSDPMTGARGIGADCAIDELVSPLVDLMGIGFDDACIISGSKQSDGDGTVF